MSNELDKLVDKSFSEMMMAHSEGNIKGLIAVYIDGNGNVRSTVAYGDGQLPYLCMGLDVAHLELMKTAITGTKPLQRNKQ